MHAKSSRIALLLAAVLCVTACAPNAPQATPVVELPTATHTALPTATLTFTPVPSPTATETLTPVPTATASPLPTATPTATPLPPSVTPRLIVVAATTAPKPASAPAGNIPPVGSGPFSADESASGPWNCIGITGPKSMWQGDFYIGVRGGPGNYTISDPQNCHWDSGEQKFVCRYVAQLNQPVMRTLYASCPGCTQQAVALSGRGVDTRDQSGGTCRVTSFIAPTPTGPPVVINPGQPTAPLYPKSPILSWNQATFIAAIKDSRDAAIDFYNYHQEVVSGKQGDCRIYWWKYYSRWEGEPGFSDVPDKWYPLYMRYRVALDDLRTGTYPVTQICLKRGGNIDEGTDKAILAALDNVGKRLDGLYAEAQARK